MAPVVAAHGTHVTRVAVEQRQFRESRGVVEARPLQRRQLRGCGSKLPVGPGLCATVRGLAALVVGVYAVVSRLDSEKRIELKAQPGMPGCHQPMRRELV